MVSIGQKRLQNANGAAYPTILFAMRKGSAVNRTCKGIAYVQMTIANAYSVSRLRGEQHIEKVELRHGDVMGMGAVAPQEKSRFKIPLNGIGKC
jgi:hypothetical protein